VIRVGIDVGGTHTDAVLMDDDTIVATAKAPTTADATAGIVDALTAVAGRAEQRLGELDAVMVGTTHFTNAFVEARDLASVAIIRLGYPATQSVPPMSDWPDDVAGSIDTRAFLCHGGNEFDGRPISPLDPAELARVADQIRREGLESIAVCGVFATVDPSCEQQAEAILRDALPGIPISLSHEIGRSGLLARENATIVNATLRPLALRTVNAFREAVSELAIQAPIFVSQNDGTIASLEQTRRFPVATFTSGPTNSMRGAAFLSGLENCAVVDIGGTTSDVGILRHGYPRETTIDAEIGRVRTNFRLPDVVSVAIGGGSLVTDDNRLVHVGPRSVGYRLTSDGTVFGGTALTATDIAVAEGRVELGDRALVAHVDPDLVQRAAAHIESRIADAIDAMRTGPAALDAVIVGGGNILLRDHLTGVRRVIRPDHADVANAVGAAIAQVGATIEDIVSMERTDRAAAVDAVIERARHSAAACGACDESIRVIDIEEVHLAYLPGRQTRIKVRVVGDLELGARRALHR
jgi:N-methylhydantoinase A/oxoprolinase/acetone carboxylase beta subunit